MTGLNAHDRAVVTQLASDYERADESQRARLCDIHQRALSDLYNRRASLERELEANGRAIAMREAFRAATFEEPT